MNGKKAKKIRKKSRQLVVDWLQTMLVKEEVKKLSVDNIEKYLPNETHVFINNRYLLSAFSLRWVYKKLKKNPNLTVEELQKDLLI